MEIHSSRNRSFSSSSPYPHRWLRGLTSPMIILFWFISKNSGGNVNFAGGGLYIEVTVTCSNIAAMSSVPV